MQLYVDSHSTPVDEQLQQIERNTNLHVLQPQMLSGGFQGKVLEFISRSINPKYILEIGTFTGFSALCLIKGLAENGQLHTIDVNEELMQRTQSYFDRSPYANQITLHIGNALQIIPTIDLTFDLVFIDADKASYAAYYNLAVENLRRGGVILVDNVLWSGKVIHDEKDKKTQQMHVFNQMVQQDERVENVLLPIRDGIMWIVKK
mgnify:CR=1 FL=1